MKGYAGRGVDVYIRENILFCRINNDKNDVAFSQYKLNIPVHQWKWIGITHCKKAMWRRYADT